MHKLITLERPLVFFDLETTGLKNARIVEIGFQVFYPDGTEKEWVSLVNPEIPIPPETTKTHGITDESVTILCWKCKGTEREHPNENCAKWKPVPTFSAIAPNIADGFKDCDYGGKNIRFDLRTLKGEMDRVRVPWSYANARVIDAERLEQIGEPRTLSHLYEKHTGRRMENAHSALADVKASVEIVQEQLMKYRVLPRNLDMLHDMQWPGWIDTEGKFKFKDGVAVCGFGKHTDKPMKSIPPDYWQWILRSDFNDEIKQLATNALKGVYPTRSDT